ncbi:MAG TPA: 2-amino-4-hydroxy-6-hydroxymethyldihydropteridine diphosphokinase [Casimicrobiaceae bacterium]|nr:2-amino-4-hydroxy-6-hydroxymethyldihydropteridine diphosphokinase [Casimicrobiaceae bacterium]
MALAYVGLGSNLAHPRRRLARALDDLARLPRTRLLRVSPNYASAPVGTTAPQPDYVNAVAQLSTRLRARALLARLLAIEHKHRRRREPGVRNAPRTLDLDLLLFGRLRMATRDLALPHPRMHLRAFALRPLADIAPHARVPGRGVAGSLARRITGQRIIRTRSHPR